MPFTFSHPAAVLPFSYLPKRYVSMTGLVIGSMAPDFEYFIRLNGTSIYSHTWPGIFYFNLPLSLLLAFLFHVIVRNILIGNLPGFIARKLVAFKNFDWVEHFKKNILVILTSIIIGAASHLIIDDFTHAHTTFVNMFSLLRKQVNVGWRHMPVFILLQYIGTIIGGVIVLFALFQLPADRSYTNKRSIIPFWIYVTIVMIMVAMLKYFFGNFPRRLDDRVVILLSGWLCGILITSFFFMNISPAEKKLSVAEK